MKEGVSPRFHVDELESHPCAELDCPVAAHRWRLRRAQQIPKAARGVECHALRIEPLIVVEKVRKDALEFQANTFGDSNVLLDRRVQIPVGQAGEGTEPAVAGVYTQNRVAIVIECGLRILEDIDRQTA